MAKNLIKNTLKTTAYAFTALSTFALSAPAIAQIDMARKPVLVITNDQMPATKAASTASNTITRGPQRAPEITRDQIASAAFFEGGETVVGNKIDGLNKDLFALQSRIGKLAGRLRDIQNGGRNLAAGYYANVATINTQLQTGTTPGNPRLVKKLDEAQSSLDQLSKNVNNLNGLAVEVADTASVGAFLLDTVRTTYNLSGAVEEDHVKLAQMEDQINNTIIQVDRVLNDVNEDISRTTAYLSTEHSNMRTLALAVSSGDLFGRSLASGSPFMAAPVSPMMQPASYTPLQAQIMPAPVMRAPAPVMQAPVMREPAPMAAAPAPILPRGPVTYNARISDNAPRTSGAMGTARISRAPLDVPPSINERPSRVAAITAETLPLPQSMRQTAPAPQQSASGRPLAKIKFDKPNVDYKQPLYVAVQNAMEKYPNAQFELIAVHPTSGNAAQVAIESTKARRNAEKVLRDLTQMGLNMNQIDLTYAPMKEARTSEVHLYLQ